VIGDRIAKRYFIAPVMSGNSAGDGTEHEYGWRLGYDAARLDLPDPPVPDRDREHRTREQDLEPTGWRTIDIVGRIQRRWLRERHISGSRRRA
jgi:hypothetical protein